MMHLLDAGRVIVMLIFFISTLRFFYLSWKTRADHPDDEIIQSHFLEHVVAASMSFVGSLLGMIYATVHLFSTTQGELSEYSFTLSTGFLVLSGVLFMIHMIKEQTPGHPYYLRENGEYIPKDKKNV